MKKYSLTTLGCKVNQFESAYMASILNLAGWENDQFHADGNLCIINTCTVTQKAAMQSRQAIRKAIRDFPNAEIIVTGCLAQTQPEQIQKIAGVRQIVGHNLKHSIPQLTGKSAGSILVDDIFTMKSAFEPENPFPSHSTCGNFVEARARAFLKIQDGCNAFCSYCIVPYARGKSHSMPVAKVLSALEMLNSAGCHEVVLTGIHLGAFGNDLVPGSSLAQLLHLIHERPITQKIRLSSIEPGEINPDLVQTISDSSQICRHFHIPLQSGDDYILSKMHRPYTRALFRDVVDMIAAKIKTVGIGADVLIGFPGETDQMFQNTYDLIASLPVTYLHVFPFSRRPGTLAWDFPDQVGHAIIKQRCRVMRELGLRKKLVFYEQNIGRNYEIMIESKRDPRTGLLKGISTNYIPILLKGDDRLMNRVVRVKISSIKSNGTVLGEYLHE